MINELSEFFYLLDFTGDLLSKSLFKSLWNVSGSIYHKDDIVKLT